MKIKLIACLGMMAGLLMAADMPRSEWHGLVGECAQNPTKLAETIKKLSAADQNAFVGEVNEAISKLPGSVDARAKIYVAANRAAIKNATEGNKMQVLAEIFATVSPEYLVSIVEDFSQDLVNAKGTSGREYTNLEFDKIAKKSVETIVDRCSTVENAGVRETLAVVLFTRGWGAIDPIILDDTVGQLPADVRAEAVKEWLPDALGVDAEVIASMVSEENGGTKKEESKEGAKEGTTAEGTQESTTTEAVKEVPLGEANYDSIMEAAEVTDVPASHPNTTPAAPNATRESLLNEMQAESSSSGDAGTSMSTTTTTSSFDPTTGGSTEVTVGLNRIPRDYTLSETDPVTKEESKYYKEDRDDPAPTPTPTPEPEPTPEPTPYPGQD